MKLKKIINKKNSISHCSSMTDNEKKNFFKPFFIQKTVTFVYLFDDKYKEFLYFTFPESKMK